MRNKLSKILAAALGLALALTITSCGNHGSDGNSGEELSSSSVVKSSSSVVKSSSSYRVPIEPSSSSEELSSSSVVKSSSSYKVPAEPSSSSNSSSSIAYTLACASVPSTGIAGMAITPPVVTCNGTTVSSGLIWAGVPDWSNPAVGTHGSISVSANSGNCSGKTADCSGTLTISSPPSVDQLTCTGLPETNVTGYAVAQPTVRCGTSTVSTGIAWAGAPASWASPAAGEYRVSATATCGGSSQTAICGTLAVSSVLACNSVPTAGTHGTPITAPRVFCNGTTISSGLNWTSAPNWSNPVAGTYSNVSVSAISGECSGITATCGGTLTVASELACASVPSTGVAGAAITAPAVTCGGTAISTGLSWTGAPSWSNPATGTYSDISVSAISGDCRGKTAACSGTLTVAQFGTVNYQYETYETVVIGTQTWFRRNLNVQGGYGKCYDNETDNCAIYGRLYNWAEAMNLAGCNSSSCADQIQPKHKGICPVGWHIPSREDLITLINFVGGYEIAGTKLKATSGWNSGGNGYDTYSFAALPGGYYGATNFANVGNTGYWWSASEASANNAYHLYMTYSNENVNWGDANKSYLRYVRCVKD